MLTYSLWFNSEEDNKVGIQYVSGDGILILGDKNGNFQMGLGSDTHTDGEMPDEEWIHLAIAGNGTTYRSYINGELKTERSYSFGDNAGYSELWIGALRRGHDEEIVSYLDGKLDEVRTHNRSLSQQEIQRLYNVRSEDWAVSGCKLTG